MGQNIIDVSFDIEKFTSQQKIIYEGLLSIYESGKAISGNIIAPGSTGGWAELTAKVNAHQKAISDLQSANVKYTQTAQQVAAANTQNAQSTAALTTATKEQTQSLQQNIDARTRAKNSMASYIASQKEDLELLRKGVITRGEYNQRVTDSDIKVEQFKNKISSLNSEIKTQTKTTKQLGGAYGILSKEYLKAQANAKNLAVQYGTESKEAKAAAASTKALSDRLKAIDSTVGQHHRNVGNYTSALDKLGAGFKRVFLRISEYASIYAVFSFFKTTVTEALDAEKSVARFQATLENIGRGDVFERLSTKAQAFTDQFKYLRKEQVIGVFEQLITYGKLTENQINELIPVITDFAAKQRITIEEATPIIIRALEGQGRGLKAYGINVKDAGSTAERLGIIMNQLAPKVAGAAEAFGKTTQGNIQSTTEEFMRLKEEIGTGLLPAINKMMSVFSGAIKGMKEFYQSFRSINDAIQDMQKKHDDDQETFANNIVNDMRGKPIEEQKKIAESYKAIYLQSQHTLSEYLKNPNNNKAQRDKLLDQQNQDEKIYLATQAALNQKPLGIAEPDADKHKEPKKEAIVKKSVMPALDLEFELYKINQKRKLKILDEEANDTKRSFAERIVFAKEYRDAEIELAKKTADHEIATDNAKLKALQDNYKKAKGTERNNLAIEIENEKKQITIVTAKYNDEIIGSEDALQKRLTAIDKEEAEKRKKIYEDEKKSIDNAHEELSKAVEAKRTGEKATHDEALFKKKIDQEEYDRLEKKSKKENDILQAQVDLKKANGALGLAIANPEEEKKALDEYVNDVIIAQNKLKSAQAEGDPLAAKKAKAAKTANVLEDVKGVTDTAASLVDIKYQKEQEAIQKIIDLNNYRKDQEIANINASTLSNQEKAAQMILLDKTVAANNKKLEREKIAMQIKQAKFDRDAAVLAILENAAIGYFKLVATNGFVGIAEGIGLGILAASQIAMLLAKPLPQMPAYAKGTENHPGGPAIVGEGKFKELVSMPGGKNFIADKPTYIPNLLAGSKVTPITNDFVMEQMTQGANMSMAERIVQSSNLQVEGNRIELSAIKEAVYETGRMTARALRKQKGANVIVNVDSRFYAHIMKVVKE